MESHWVEQWLEKSAYGAFQGNRECDDAIYGYVSLRDLQKCAIEKIKQKYGCFWKYFMIRKNPIDFKTEQETL